MMRTLERIAELIKEQDGFTLIAHVSPDGDTLGSSLALYGMLKKLGKQAEVVCDDAMPQVYSFLPWAMELVSPDAAHAYKNAISVDCADVGRMGRAAQLFDDAEHTAVIDHHITNSGYAEINVVEDVAATGELVFRLSSLLLPEMDRNCAACLYAALMTDTGNFAYGNTTPNTLRIAAELLEYGIDNYEINQRIYRTMPLRKTRLLGLALKNLHMECSDRVGISTLTHIEMESVGAQGEDTEGLIDHVRDIETVEIAMLIRESAPETFKVSLRSKHSADVSAIAGRMGGGGHVRAAGYTAHGSLQSVYAQALELAEAELAGEL